MSPMDDCRYLRPSRLLSRTPRLICGPTETPSPTQTIIRMDPDCAICASPANIACECEAKSLELAIKHAEQRVMQTVYQDIRQWARSHAQDYILEHFRQLTERRKAAHAAHIDRITNNSYRLYQMPPAHTEIVAAQAQLKRGIDQDWQDSVSRYPDVLEYFFGLVELTLPGDSEPAVKNPPLNAIPSPRKAGRRPNSLPGPPPMAAIGYNMPTSANRAIMTGSADMGALAPLPGRRGSTPPHLAHHSQMMVRRPLSPPTHMDRRTPGPRDDRMALRDDRVGPRRISYRGALPPGGAPAYYGGY